MTESIAKTILQVAEADPATTAEQLAALREVCAGQPRRRFVRSLEARRILGGGKDPISVNTLTRWVQAGLVRRYGRKGIHLYDADELREAIAAARQ